jgi:hypothetical protein
MMISSLDRGMRGRVRAVMKGHTSQPRTRPSNDTQCRPSSTTNGRIFSMASSTMEDRDSPETPDTNHHPTSTAAEHTEKWDDDFEIETRNNSPRRPRLSTPRRREVREESWDDELELPAKRDDLDGGFGPPRRGGQDCHCSVAACSAFLVCTCESFAATIYAVLPV